MKFHEHPPRNTFIKFGFKSPAKSLKYDGITSFRSGIRQSLTFYLMLRTFSRFRVMKFNIFHIFRANLKSNVALLCCRNMKFHNKLYVHLFYR